MDRHRLHGCGFYFGRATPDKPFALQEIPDLFHMAVADGSGSLTRTERRQGEAGPGGVFSLSDQESDLRPIRCLDNTF